MTKAPFLATIFILFSLSLFSQSIELSLRDSLIKDQLGDNKANPGDTILYKLMITVSGDTAKNVLLDTMNFSPYLMLNSASLHVNPLARKDSFDCLGNVGLNVLAAGGLLINDVDPDQNTGTISLTKAGYPAPSTAVNTQFTTAKGGKATCQADGSFVYTPATGATGVDSFYYEISDGDPVSPNNIGLVLISVQNMIWFVDNSSVAAGSSGSLSAPFKTLAEMNTANAAGGSKDPKDGDIIYIYKGSGDYTGGLTLRLNQKLLGQGSSTPSFATLSGLSIPSSSTALPIPDAMGPQILNAAGDGITLHQNNTVNGINIGNTNGMALKNSGMTAVGTLTVRDVDISGTGGGMNISDGGIMDVIIKSLSTTSQTGSLINLGPGIVSGSITVNAGSASNVTGSMIKINGGSASLTYKGSLTQGNNASLLEVSNGHTGTLSFNTGTLSASNGNGLQFNNADGTYNFDGTTTLNGGDAGIDILNGSGGIFTFSSGTSITNSSGQSFRENTGTSLVAYNGTITQNNAAKAVDISSKTGGSSSFAGTIIANTSTTNGIDLTNNTGTTLNFSGGLDLDCTTGTGFNATGGGTVNITGSNTIDKNNTGPAFNLANTNAGGSGITFNSIRVTGGTGTAVNISSSSGVKNLGDIDVMRTGGGTGLLISNGGTISNSSGDINSGSLSAVDIDNTALNMILTSVTSTGGTTAGIDLNITTGSFTVVGDNSNTTVGGNGSGGTISNKSGDAIVLSGTTNIILRRMILGTMTQQITDNGLQLSSATETYLEYCTIQYTGNSGVNGLGGNNVGFRFNDSIARNTGNATGDDAFQFGETDQTNHLTGTVQFINSQLMNFYNKGIRIRNYGGLLNLNISNSSFSGSTEGQAVLLEADGPVGGMTGAEIRDSITNCVFSNLRLEGVFANAIESGSKLTSNILNNTFNQGQSIASIVVSFGVLLISDNGTHNFNIKGNTLDDLATGIAASNNKNGKLSGYIGASGISNKNQFTNTNDSDAMFLVAEGQGGTGMISTVIVIDNNTINGPGDEGIEINNRGLGNTGGAMHATVVNNTIGNITNVLDVGIQSRMLDNSQSFITLQNNTISANDESIDIGAQNTSIVHSVVENNNVVQPNDDLEVKTLSGTGELMCLRIANNTLSANNIELTSIASATFNVQGGIAAVSAGNGGAMLVQSGTFGTASCTVASLPTF